MLYDAYLQAESNKATLGKHLRNIQPGMLRLIDKPHLDMITPCSIPFPIYTLLLLLANAENLGDPSHDAQLL